MARIDYLRAGFVYDVRAPGDSRMKEYIESDWNAYWGKNFPEGPGEPTAPARMEKLLVKGGATMIIFECWGPWSEAFCRQSNWIGHYADRIKLLRMDYRQSVVSDVDLDRIFYAVEAKGGSNVHTFNSRVRQKNGDRDAGGVGFSIGSHKSDRRLVVYQRGHEQAAIEVQLRTRALQVAHEWLLKNARPNSGCTAEEQHKGLMDAMQLSAQQFVVKHTKHSIGQLAQGEITYDHETHERILGEIEKRFKALSPMAQQSFIMMAQDEEGDASALTRFNLA